MWQTRTLATFIAATVPVAKAGDVNPLLEIAKEIGLPTTEVDTRRSNSSIDARENPDLVDNGDASFERFMSTFGSPARWAGRS